MSEVDLYTPIIAAINQTGLACVWRNQSGKAKVRGGWMHLSPVGTPDIVGYMRRTGLFVGLEVKKPGERPSVAQEAWGYQLQQAGGVAACVTSVQQALEVIIKTERKTKP